MLTSIDLSSMSRGALENLLDAVEYELKRRAQETAGDFACEGEYTFEGDPDDWDNGLEDPSVLEGEYTLD